MQPEKQPWNNTTKKSGHKCIGTTLPKLKMDSKSLKTVGKTRNTNGHIKHIYTV